MRACALVFNPCGMVRIVRVPTDGDSDDDGGFGGGGGGHSVNNDARVMPAYIT